MYETHGNEWSGANRLTTLLLIKPTIICFFWKVVVMLDYWVIMKNGKTKKHRVGVYVVDNHKTLFLVQNCASTVNF